MLSGCIDDNECVDDPCGENSMCENSIGSFQCTCLGGYSGDGFTCRDVNECRKNPCEDARTCVNFDGGFRCECSESIGTGIKEAMFSELYYIDQPSNYDGVPRAELPPQNNRVYPGCTEKWFKCRI